MTALVKKRASSPVKLHFIHFVVKERRPCKLNRVFLCNALVDFGRGKKRIAVVLPVGNVVSEILRLAVADGVDVNDLRCLEPVRLKVDALCHIADRNHIGHILKHPTDCGLRWQAITRFGRWSLSVTAMLGQLRTCWPSSLDWRQ
jgi:hypothetical protein